MYYFYFYFHFYRCILSTKPLDRFTYVNALGVELNYSVCFFQYFSHPSTLLLVHDAMRATDGVISRRDYDVLVVVVIIRIDTSTYVRVHVGTSIYDCYVLIIDNTYVIIVVVLRHIRVGNAA